MGTCCVTGLVTNSKWEGVTVHPLVKKRAKNLEKRYPRSDMRWRLKFIYADLDAQAKEIKPTNVHEYIDFLNYYFEKERHDCEEYKKFESNMERKWARAGAVVQRVFANGGDPGDRAGKHPGLTLVGQDKEEAQGEKAQEGGLT